MCRHCLTGHTAQSVSSLVWEASARHPPMKKPDARNRILAKASALFFERGYSQVGINEIIEESGTAKATFYHHFPSKKSLCEAWLTEVHRQCEGDLVSLLKADGDPVSKVARYFDQLLDYLKANDFRGCPYSNTAVIATTEESIIRRIRQHKDRIRDFFRQLAAQIIEPDSSAASQLGDALFLLHSGATTEAQNLRDSWPVLVAREAGIRLCRQALGSGGQN
jgi:AcrR family transcriptional regulator